MKPADAYAALEPRYSLTELEPSVQWWWFEGYFWGRHEEIQKQEGLHLAYRQLLMQKDEQIQAQVLTIKALRHDFTYKSLGVRNA
jgi:hypothetical protein